MKLFVFMVSLVVAFKAFAAVPIMLDNPKVMSYVDKHLPSCGSLQKAPNDLVYLKISDRYINDVFPLLVSSLPPAEAKDLMKPPYMGQGKAGAHISVIYPGELPQALTSFPEKGRKECFTVTNLAYVDPEKGPFQRVYYLRVLSGDLKKVRQNYALSPQYNNQEFHITIGVILRPENN